MARFARPNYDQRRAELDKLQAMKEAIPGFGPIHHRIDVSMAVVNEVMNNDELYDAYGPECENGAYDMEDFDAALQAYNWITGETDKTPSEYHEED